MTTFIARDPEATRILSEELEKKIDAVNAHLVEARNETEKFIQTKNKLEGEAKELAVVKEKLTAEVLSLGSQRDGFLSEIAELKEKVEWLKKELVNVNKQLTELEAANKEEIGKLDVEREELKKRRNDLEGQESILRTFSKGLEEKEKKLDVYADRVKRLLDSVKSE
jgi:phage shock protein A